MTTAYDGPSIRAIEVPAFRRSTLNRLFRAWETAYQRYLSERSSMALTTWQEIMTRVLSQLSHDLLEPIFSAFSSHIEHLVFLPSGELFLLPLHTAPLHAPTWKRHARRRSAFDPYAAYVLGRWQNGVHEVKHLYEEIQAHGFPGTIRIVGRFVQALRDDPEQLPLPPPTAADHFSSTTAARWFIRDPKQLTAEQHVELELICPRRETARTTYELTQQVMTMLRLRRGQNARAVARSGRSQLHRGAASVCPRLVPGQGGRRGWLDALRKQWAGRGPGPQAQISQALHVLPRQTAAVTTTLAPCRLTWRGPFVRYPSSPDDDLSEQLSHVCWLIGRQECFCARIE